MTWMQEYRPLLDRIGFTVYVVACWTLFVLIVAFVCHLDVRVVVGRLLLGLCGLVASAELAAGVLSLMVQRQIRARLRIESAAKAPALARVLVRAVRR